MLLFGFWVPVFVWNLTDSGFSGFFKAFQPHFKIICLVKRKRRRNYVICIESNLGQTIEFVFLWHGLSLSVVL